MADPNSSSLNVAPIRSGQLPPSGPSRKPPPKRPEDEIDLRFRRGQGGGIAADAFVGLKGVVQALYALDGDDAANLEGFTRLSAAASVLIDILEEHQA